MSQKRNQNKAKVRRFANGINRAIQRARTRKCANKKTADITSPWCGVCVLMQSVAVLESRLNN